MTAALTGPRTRDTLVLDFDALGVRKGDVLYVQASLRSVGWVCGGAQTVVSALLDVLGPAGTLVVPTHTADNSDPSRWHLAAGRPVPEEWWPAIRAALPPFDPLVSPGSGGAVSETVRTWPGARRSDHPQTSAAAVGPAAVAITAGHSPTCHLGERSPLARLAEHDARILLLGVGFAACTAFHLAEYRVPDPPTRTYSCVVRTPEGRCWVEYEDVALDAGDFEALGADLSATGLVTHGQVGSASAMLVPLGQAVAFATAWLPRHRTRMPV